MLSPGCWIDIIGQQQTDKLTSRQFGCSSIIMARWCDYLLAFLFGFEALGSLADGCPSGWRTWYDACYLLHPDPVTWQKATEVCAESGSRLVVPKSRDENDVVLSMAKEVHTQRQAGLAVWIDCYRGSPAADFKCSGGKENMTFTYWADDRPIAPHECVKFWSGGYGQWVASPCNKFHFAACKMANIPQLHCSTADANGRLVN